MIPDNIIGFTSSLQLNDTEVEIALNEAVTTWIHYHTTAQLRTHDTI